MYLSTVHSVKGLEFDHVFVLGGSWRETTGSELEEERRLFYVAMTRARETLQLFELDHINNPHTQGLDGEFLLKRRVEVPGRIKYPNKRYHILGMKDLYLGYAGGFRENDKMHEAIRTCKMGDKLKVAARNGHIYLTNDTDTIIGRMSKAARDSWLPKVDSIREVNVLAMVRWSKEDITDKEFLERCKCEAWEVPVCELVCG